MNRVSRVRGTTECVRAQGYAKVIDSSNFGASALASASPSASAATPLTLFFSTDSLLY